MKRCILALSFLAVLAGLSSGQTAPAPPSSAITAAKEDVISIDAIIHALYDVISGPAGQQRNWDRMKSLFTPDGSMAYVVITPKGDFRRAELNVDKYRVFGDSFFQKNSFYEHEISRKTEQFGHMASVFSAYSSQHDPKEKPFERGINSLQLINDGKRWWIRTILWEGESKDVPLPRKYEGKG